jgi:hypothetical protein
VFALVASKHGSELLVKPTLSHLGYGDLKAEQALPFFFLINLGDVQRKSADFCQFKS